MKQTAKFQRSLRYLFYAQHTGLLMWADEMVAMTEEQWDKVISCAGVGQGPYTVVMQTEPHAGSSWKDFLIPDLDPI